MRVTNNMMIINMMENLNRNLTRMSKDQHRLSTGKNINSPMDDPVGVSKIIKYKSDIAELHQFDRNARDALSWLEHSESAMVSLGESYHRVSELATQGANGTYGEDDRQMMKSELEQIKSHIVSTANSSFAGRYIFSNFRTDTKLMKEDGSYNMDITSYDMEGAEALYQIGVGENIKVNTNGVELFGHVPVDNVMTKVMPDPAKDSSNLQPGKAATSGSINVEFSQTKDYSSSTIKITVGSEEYTVPSEKMPFLNGSAVYPTKKQTIIDSLYSAKTAGTPPKTLSEVADVYYDDNAQLKIVSKATGVNSPTNPTTISATATGGTNNPVFFGAEAATDAIPSKAVGSNVLNDADIAAATDKQSFVMTLNGRSETISIDMSTVNDVAGFKAAMQTAIDAKFPAGANNVTIKVNATAGNPLSFETNDPAGTSSVNKHDLDVRAVQTQKSKVIEELDELITALDNGDNDVISSMIDKFKEHTKVLLRQRSSIGARVNRLELSLNRSSDNKLSFTKLLSNVQDADIAEVIMNMKNSENIYRASLQTGAKVIQPSLMDFLR